jgi:flagella basal body P-ring formation protein FlgA
MDRSTSKFRRGVAALAAMAITTVAGAAHAATARGLEPLSSIRDTAERFARAQLPPGDSGIRVRAGPLDPRLRLAGCLGPLAASLLDGAQLAARMSVAVGCRRGADWTIYVPVTVESRIRVWALRAPQMQGARLTAGDLVPEKRLVTGLEVGYVTDLAALAHSTLRHPLPAGAVLTVEDLLPDFVVRQGQQVTLLAALAGIEVRAAGVALQSGRYGAVIRVQNVSSSKVVEGIVEADRVVRVSP